MLLEQQRRLEEQRQQQEQLMQPRPPAEIEKPPPPAPSKGNGAKVLVTRFTFSGNTVIPTNEMEKIVAPYIGKELTVRELKDVAGRISEHYLANGYLLGQAYLPPQEIKGGLIEIAILEGKVGEIGVTGNQRYESSSILRAMEPVKRRGVIHEATLETALNELNDYPGLKVRADLKPGATRSPDPGCTAARWVSGTWLGRATTCRSG